MLSDVWACLFSWLVPLLWRGTDWNNCTQLLSPDSGTYVHMNWIRILSDLFWPKNDLKSNPDIYFQTFFFWRGGGGRGRDRLLPTGYYHTMIVVLLKKVTVRTLLLILPYDDSLCVRSLMVTVTNDDVSMFTQPAASNGLTTLPFVLSLL